MSLISYIRQFGVRNAFAKAQSIIALRLFARGVLREVPSVDPATIQGLTSVDTTGMAADYKAYVEEQISRSVKRSAYLNPLRAKIGSRDQLIQQVARAARAWKVPCTKALSIGCRDERELDAITRLLRCDDVTGVDLFSASPRIRTADMHDLPFESGTFDISFAIHCMEHSYDARKSLAEMLRVTRSQGLLAVEVPVGYEVTDFDRNDFRGVLELAALFPAQSVSLQWAEVENRANVSKPPTVRIILQKRPSGAATR
jgi:SAM-dependent methyltransferase